MWSAYLIGGDVRCEDGWLYRHDPQLDDPYLETRIGRCPKCNGKGCEDGQEDVPEPVNQWVIP